MSNARLALAEIDKWGVAQAWTGRAYVWIVPDIGEDNCCTDLVFDSHADALAYVNALRAVEVAGQAALTLPEELVEELISDPYEMRRERQRESQYWTALARGHNGFDFTSELGGEKPSKIKDMGEGHKI